MIKLNRLKDTNAKDESHKDFLLHCIQAGLTLKGLKLELETTIENQNLEVLDNWYTKLKDFLLILMKDIVKYCYNAIKENGVLTSSTEALLKQNIEKEEYKNIEEVILQNKETTKQTVKQQKFKKFNYLKSKAANEKILQLNETHCKATLTIVTQIL